MTNPNPSGLAGPIDAPPPGSSVDLSSLPTSPPLNGDSGHLFAEEVEIVGHIIDSLILPKVLDEIITLGGRFEIVNVRIGNRRTDPSYARLNVSAETPETLDRILAEIGQHGAVPIHQQDCRLIAADMNG